MYQYYVMEIQQYANGEYGDIRHFAYDEDQTKAKLKAESKYHEVLAAAAISNLPCHAAIMFSSEGYPMLHQCYKHVVVEATAEHENETETVEVIAPMED